MDAYDLMMDKYRAEQRFRQEVKEELAIINGCKDKCKADPTRLYCLGCGRTIEEIVRAGLERTRDDHSKQKWNNSKGA